MNTLTLPVLNFTDTKYDLALFIGRFQPFHEGHMSVIDMAFKSARNVLLLGGSANSPRSHRNPFTYPERVQMIFDSVGTSTKGLYALPLEDTVYNDPQWVLNVQTAVEACLDEIAEVEQLSISQRRKMRVALIGHSKDNSSYYLNIFPGYDSLRAPNFKNVSSTPMRSAYFSNIGDMWLKNCDGHRIGDNKSEHLVTTAVRKFMIDFAKTPEYADIRAEYEFINDYRAKMMVGPFPVTMVTTDALVVQSGHILLVRRKGRPGKGLWALPGGYLNQSEKIVDGMVRELIEETRIGVPASDLKKAIVASRVFDDPNRDPRGRVITHGFHIDLPSRRTLMKITKKKVKDVPDLEIVEGADDAEYAKWFPFSAVKRNMMFADHMDIIKSFGILV